MENNLLRYVPKILREHIQDIYKDSDGIWCEFDDSVIELLTGYHTLHVFSVKEFKTEISKFEVVK